MDEYRTEYDDYLDRCTGRTRAARFRDPGGTSALHPGRRTKPCPTCGQPQRLTARDVAKGYQCDTCAARAEGTYVGADY